MKKNKAKSMSCCILSLIECLFLSSGLSASAMMNNAEEPSGSSGASAANNQRHVENKFKISYSSHDVYILALTKEKGGDWAIRVVELFERMKATHKISDIKAVVYALNFMSNGGSHKKALIYACDYEYAYDTLGYDLQYADDYATYRANPEVSEESAKKYILFLRKTRKIFQKT